MEVNEKAFARQKFRSNRGRGRGGRGGAPRGGQHGGPTRQTHKDLDGNAYRYEDEVNGEDSGEVAPRSQGANLETLIEDADVQFNQAFHRFRAHLHDITDEAPPMGATSHPEQQLLATDLDALAASLSALPLHALLGLEPEYLAGIEPEVSLREAQGREGLGQPGAVERRSGGVKQSVASGPPPPAPSAAGAGMLQQQQQQQQPQPVPPTPPVLLPSPEMPVPSPAALSISSAVGQAAGATASRALTGAGGGAAHDDDADELEALLTGRVTARSLPAPPLSSAAGAPEPGAAAAGPAASRPPGLALPPGLAAVMGAARTPQPSPQAATVTRPTTSNEDGGGPAVPAAEPGAGPPPASAPISSGLVGAPSPAEACPSARAPGLVRLVPTGTPGPVAAPPPAPLRPAPTNSVPGARIGPAAGLPSARLVGLPAQTAASHVSLASNRAAGAGAGIGVGGVAALQAALAGPALRQGQTPAVAGVSASAASCSGGGGAGGGTGSASAVDEELRLLLLGLPVVAGPGGPLTAGPATAATHATSMQVHPPPGSRPAATTTAATLPPAPAGRPAPPPVPQQPPQTPAKSLDDWLNSL